MHSRCARSTSAVFGLLLFLVFAQVGARATMSYGVGARCSSGVYVVDYDSGMVSELFKTSIGWIGATDGDPRHPNTFYATPYYGGFLYKVDVGGSETVTPVGNGYGGVQITGLAYDEKRDILYATDYRNLYTIDIIPGSPTEGEPSLVGRFGACGEGWAFDYDESLDELVVMTQACRGTKTYYIDRETGEADYVGFTCKKRITDIWYDAESGDMFGVGNKPCSRGKLYRIDPETGKAVKIGCIWQDLLGLGKPHDAVPEPATVALLCLGALLLRRRRR